MIIGNTCQNTGDWGLFMDEYILFIDETLKTSKNPYFCMSGICVKRNYYEDIITQKNKSLKIRHINSTDFIFHYSEMNNKKGVFNIFSDGTIRKNFWTDFVSTIKNMDFTAIGVYFDQSKMSALYKSKSIKCYNIAFVELLKNYVHYLKSINGIGSICIESRSFKENAELQHIYYNFIQNGSVYFSQQDFDTHLSSVGFVVKGDNCIGLQIADVLPSALLRKINGTKDFYNIGDMYRKKLYCYNTEDQDILGFKNIL